jgi:hypothetical protein
MFQSWGIPRESPQELAILCVMGAIIYANVYIFLRWLGRRNNDPALPRTWLCLGGAFVGIWVFQYVGFELVVHTIDDGWGRMAIGLWTTPLTLIGGAVAGYLLVRHWAYPDGTDANRTPTRRVIRGTALLMLTWVGLFVALQVYFNWTSWSAAARERAVRAPAVAALLAEINEKREWRDIYFGCGIVEKHLGKSDRVGLYVKQFEAYGAVSSKPFLANGKYWRQFAFDRSLLRGVPHSRFWLGDTFSVAFQLSDDGPDAVIEKCNAVLWAAFPYI